LLSYTGSYHSKRYLGSKLISNFLRNDRYSSLKHLLLWCSGWFNIYFTTLSGCDLEYVNARYPSCHEKCPDKNRLSLIHFEEPAFICSISFEIDIVGCIPTKICAWSGLQKTASGFDLCLVSSPHFIPFLLNKLLG